MKSEDLQFLATLVRQESGLALLPAKAHFIEMRLSPVAKRHGFKDVSALVAGLRGGDPLGADIVEAMTTHESYFFRDKISFDLFRDAMLPALMESNAAARRLRLWCAGASTGQEPYSLAMVLEGMAEKLADWSIHILATDMDARVLERARTGLYSQYEILRGLPIQMLARHFSRLGDEWLVSNAARRRVHFRIFNLLQSFQDLGMFDVIFCRHVLIHFDKSVKQDVLARLGGALKEGGYLVLGSDETVAPLKDIRPLENARGAYIKVRR